MSSGNLAMGGNTPRHRLLIRDDNFFGPSTLTSATGFTNHGRIALETPIGYGVTLAITSGTLTNTADGAISVSTLSGRPATISGHVVNLGTLSVPTGGILSLAGNAPSFDQNAGTLNVIGSFPVTGATLTYNGGRISTPLVLTGATLNLAAAARRAGPVL